MDKTLVYGTKAVGFKSHLKKLNSDENKIANQTNGICVNAIAVHSRKSMNLRWKSVLRSRLCAYKKSELASLSLRVDYKQLSVDSRGR